MVPQGGGLRSYFIFISVGFCGGLDGKEPAMWETWVRSLGWEDTLEEGMKTHSSTLLPGKSHKQRSLAGFSPWGR